MPFEYVDDLIDCRPEECTCTDGSTQTPDLDNFASILEGTPLKFIGDLRPIELFHDIIDNICEEGSSVEVGVLLDGMSPDTATINSYLGVHLPRREHC